MNIDTETGNRNREERLASSIDSLLSWVESCNLKGYEPFDALLSPVGRLVKNSYTKRLFIQLVRHCPVNLRPLFGIRPHESSMGMGCMASGYLNMYRCTRNAEYRSKAESCLEWLKRNKSTYFKDYTWGHHFDWVSRSGPHPKHMPTIVWTSLIGHSFFDAYETLEKVEYLEIVSSICRWILELPREKADGGACISYVHFRQDSIHNSNMLGSSLLARYAARTGDRRCMDAARDAMRYSCERQLPDGSWYYGEAPMLRWIDNFHTAYNLDSLKYYLQSIPNSEYESRLEKAYQYYKKTFIEGNGRPRYYNTRVYPIDIQCASQSITTLANFVEFDEEAEDLAWRVADWTIENMQDKNGFFHYRLWPTWRIRTPMFHWGQATMFKGLALLYLMSDRKRSRNPVYRGTPQAAV